MNTKGKYSISLCMIAKNEGENLRGLWQSVKNLVSEWIIVDTGSTDETVKIAKELGAKVIEVGDRFTTEIKEEHLPLFQKYKIDVKVGDKVFEFGKARTFSFEQATQQFILWLDGDDILVGSDRLHRIVDSNLDPNKQLGIHLLYKYEMDQYNNCVTAHYRERIVPNNKTCKWTGRIHEIIVPTIETQYIKVSPEDCHVMHVVGEDRKKNSGERNVRALLLDLYEQGDKPDPRTLLQLAESMKIAGNPEVKELYEKYLELSRWDEERCTACVKLCNYYLAVGDYYKAVEWAYKAIKERPDFPVSYSALAQAYYGLEEFAYMERFAKEAINCEQPDTLVMVNEKYDKFIPMYLLSEVYLRTGRVKDSLAFCQEAMKWEPLNANLLKIQYTCQRMLRENEIVQAYGKITEYLKDVGELEKAKLVSEKVPYTLEEEPRIHLIRKELEGEMEKRSQSWISETKRLEVGKPIDHQYLLFEQDLRRFGCKSLLLVSNEPLLAGWFKQKGYSVKRVVKFENITQKYDAVFYDYNLHMIESRLDFFDTGLQYCNKIVGLCVPNQDPQALVACTPWMVDAWISYRGRSWNVMPLANGVIYGIGKVFEDKGTKITFFCGGDHVEEWGPLSHIDGCGGSEEAVIYLSKELAKLGYEVEVINSYPHPCIVEGVKWRHISSVKPEEKFQTVILWRIPHYLDQYDFKAEQTYLWLHDVPEEYWFTPERIAKINKIICLSKYHRTLLSNIPDDKFIISQNGVDLSQFSQDVERNPNKVIYTSSYDRGLEHLLKIWPDVRKEVPNAELHIFYGWGTYDKLRTEEEHRKWKSWIMEQCKQPGVFEHGRIGQLDLAKELLSSSIFAYPCHFEEISCISAMKSQAAGCIPLTTDYAALAETNLDSNYKVQGNPKDNPKMMELYRDMLISLLNGAPQDGFRVDLAKRAWEKFSWVSVAKQWSQFIQEEANVRSTNS